MLPGAIFSGIDGTRQYEIGEPGTAASRGSSRPKRTRSGFFGALASAADDRAKRDEDLDAKAKKAKELAESYKKATLKVGPDISVMEGDKASEFELEEPGRKGFGGVIGAGLGYAFGGPSMAKVGQSLGEMF